MARPSGSYTKFKSFPALGPRISTRHETGGCDRIKRENPPSNHFHAWRMRTHDSHGGSSDLGCTSSTSGSRRRAAIRRSEACFRGRYVPYRHEMSGRDRIERDAPHPPSILPRARARTTRTPTTPISVARAAYLVCPSGSDPRANLARFRGSHPRNTRPTHRPIAMKSHHTAQKCVRTREL